MTQARIATWLDRHWKLLALAAWLILCAWGLWQRWGGIHWFALGDTDDNLRMQQVRDWLAGQGWADLRQYRLNPPAGADIHWSRLVDLPIAALILILRLFMSPFDAERWAAALAPLIPLAVLVFATGAVARRAVHPLMPVPVWIALGFSTLLMNMFMPLRIDHHGWQLALLSVVMVGLVAPDGRRGGAIIGLATAASIAIGMEMLPYLALAGAALVLRWVWLGEDERPRLQAYGLSLTVGLVVGYLLFASVANRGPRCDALSPAWLSTLAAAGVAAMLLARLRAATPGRRFAFAVLAGAVLGAGFLIVWPGCTSNLEGISPQVKRLWFDNIREVRPITKQPTTTWVPLIISVALGLIGHALLVVRSWGKPQLSARASLGALALASALMLLWQGRAGPAALLFALPGLAALVLAGWAALRPILPWPVAGALALGLAVLIGGAGAQQAVHLWPKAAAKAKTHSDKSKSGKPKPDKPTPALMARRCSTIPAHAPLMQLPRAKIFTFVDLAPRLITLTRHSSITGPYHRNGALILDVHRAFRARADKAESIIRGKHHADYVMICPGSPESTLYLRDSPGGLYGMLAEGRTPGWLEPVALSGKTPFRLWRVRPPAPLKAHAPLDVARKSPTSGQ